MAVIRAAPGELLDVSAEFRGSAGQALTGAGPAVWAIRDPNNATVVNGVGIQDSVNPALWAAKALIPSSVPVSDPGSKYTLQWRLPLAGDSDAYVAESFPVVAGGDASVLAKRTDVLTAAGQSLSDILYLDEAGSEYSYKVIDEAGTVRLPSSQFTIASAVRGGNLMVQAYTPTHALTVAGGGIGFYLGVWTWKDPDGFIVSENHPVYLVSPKAAGMIINLRKLLDKARLSNITPYLEFTDADLLHYIIRGIEWVNTAGMHLTSFNLEYMGYGLGGYVEKAAAIEAGRAQALAEGQSDADFQGLGVQLTTNRTQYWTDFVQQLQSEMEGITQAKRAWEQAGKPTDDSVAANPGSAGYRRAVVATAHSIGAYTNIMYQGFGGEGELNTSLALSSLRQRWGTIRL